LTILMAVIQPSRFSSYSAGQYGVARNTIRRAVEDLRTSGLLETFHGRGTHVAQQG
jgi:DNA-binding FadR family transcriptional regulator